MLLAIDVGNTQTVIGLFDPDEPDPASPDPESPDPDEKDGDLVDHWRIVTVAERTSDELALLLRQFIGWHGVTPNDQITGIAISSVVPTVTAALRQMSERHFGVTPCVIEPGVRTGMPILYENPKEVGADRIANAVAAYDLYGGPSIVVDFGTATTLDAISAKGEYLGGAILPGIEVSMDALFGRAAALFRVEMVEPRSVIGKNTTESMQSGAIHGFTGQVDHLVRCFVHELGDCTVVATGGLASLIAPLSTTIQHQEPWLTLYGLRIVYERNR